MTRPFPGMDPWLEDASVWAGFHDILIVSTVELLQPQLRARGYYANPGERLWPVEPRRPIYPDVALIRREQTTKPAREDVALLEPDEPVRVQQSRVEVHEGFVEIFDAVGGRLVTGIEYVSPANKSDREGRSLYQRKQEEMRDAGVSLVEIDFIRRGPHVLDVPEEVVEQLRPWDYLVNTVRRNSTDYELYPIKLRDRLPKIRIPLKSGEEDAVLDLQEACQRAYAIGPYPERINYNSPPATLLSADDAAWADKILRDKGLRT
ncbi:MAG: DUF4058 family protein [Pirellulaceae bacterium]